LSLRTELTFYVEIAGGAVGLREAPAPRAPQAAPRKVRAKRASEGSSQSAASRVTARRLAAESSGASKVAAETGRSAVQS
jgi:hypothetical protein